MNICYIFFLPNEILREILLFTSPKEAGAFSCVSKQANMIASDTVLWKIFCKRVLEEEEFMQGSPKKAYEEYLIMRRYFSSPNDLFEKIIGVLEETFSCLEGRYISKNCIDLMNRLPFHIWVSPISSFVKDELNPVERKNKQIISSAKQTRFNDPIDPRVVLEWQKSTVEKSSEKLLPYLEKSENRRSLAEKLKKYKQNFSVCYNFLTK